MNKKNIAEVIPLNMHLDRGFHYLIPPDLDKTANIGKRVKIIFRNKARTGVIVNITGETDFKNLKEIEEIIDPFPVLSPEILILSDWISKYYLCPKGTILTHMIPSRVSKKKITSLLDGNMNRAECPDEKDIAIGVQEKSPHESNQQYSLFSNHILKNEDGLFKPLLFHYCTYQARDRYYDRWIKKFVQQGKQVLILIPDQWCCVKLKKKIAQEYGKTLGIFDKKVNQWQKYLRFLHVQRGDIRIVIGTRSNVFLPFSNLGLIIMEQENSHLYKEERVPRYQAREVAIARGRLGACKVILGSFAPSIESYWHSMNHHYLLKTEKNSNYAYTNFPRVEVINMEKEKAFQRMISFRLQQQMIQCIRENNQVVLFLNRRGIASYMVCSQCGYVIKCPDCNHLLSCHREENKEWVVCHECGKKVKMEKYCPKCGKGVVKPMGFGTQFVETMIKRMFPKAVVQRFDVDIAPGQNLQKKIFNEFNLGKIDILIGTQLIFRELNYQHVGLLGIIFADYLLNIPDYQSAESSFQLIYQLALNLAETKKSKTLIIQTYQPEHHTLQAIEQFNYSLFYLKEMMFRKELEYPPFTQMIRIDFVGKKREKVKKSALDFIDYTHQTGLAFLDEMNFQLNRENLMIVKDKDKNKASCLLKINANKQNLEHFKEKLFPYILKYKSNDVKLIIDVQPMKMV